MPKKDSPEKAINAARKLFEEILDDIPIAVSQACRNLGHHPSKMEFEGFVSRITLLLMDNDFHTLRSFANGSTSKTWLFTIAKRHILHLLQKQKREARLEDLPPNSFPIPPDQEQQLILEEREKHLLVAISKLTERERKLFYLITQELSAEEIANKMGVKKDSVYRGRSALIKKLQNMYEPPPRLAT